jgi:ApbE superfamily uncharacterized protein (UPF0280 family)
MSVERVFEGQGGKNAAPTPHSGVPLVERFYRAGMGGRFHSWTLSLGESDLWIGVSAGSWNPEMESVAREALRDARSQIEGYVSCIGGIPVHAGHEHFMKSLEPLPEDPVAPFVVRAMLEAGASAGVGPMAAVAGAIAAYVGNALATAFKSSEIIVENGGDLWLRFDRPLEVAVFSGNSPFSRRIAVELLPELSPCGLCTSSGTIGPSLSFGYADAAVILCRDAALADAWATAACNAVQSSADIQPVLSLLRAQPNILGSLIIVDDKMGIQGKLRLRPRH